MKNETNLDRIFHEQRERLAGDSKYADQAVLSMYTVGKVRYYSFLFWYDFQERKQPHQEFTNSQRREENINIVGWFVILLKP